TTEASRSSVRRRPERLLAAQGRFGVPLPRAAPERLRRTAGVPSPTRRHAAWITALARRRSEPDCTIDDQSKRVDRHHIDTARRLLRSPRTRPEQLTASRP